MIRTGPSSKPNCYLFASSVFPSLADRRTSGSAPCSRRTQKWIERAAEAGEESKDGALVDDARHDDDDRRKNCSLDSAAVVVLPLVDATSEFLAVRGAENVELALPSQPAAANVDRLSSAAEAAERARLCI